MKIKKRKAPTTLKLSKAQERILRKQLADAWDDVIYGIGVFFTAKESRVFKKFVERALR